MAGQTLSGQTTTIFASNSLGTTNLGTWTDASPGESICVRITGNYVVTLAALLKLPSTISVTATAIMDVESP